MTPLLLLLAWGLAPRPRRVRRRRGLQVTAWLLRSLAGLAVLALAGEHGGYRAVADHLDRITHPP